MLALPHIEPRNWVQQDWSTVKWGAFLNVMFWCDCLCKHYLKRPSSHATALQCLARWCHHTGTYCNAIRQVL